MSIKSEISTRVYIGYFVLVLAGLAILGMIFRTQQIEGKYWKAVSDSTSTSYRTIEAGRGNIYSADGRLLATSLPFFEVRMNPCADWLADSTFNRYVGPLSDSLAALVKDTTARYYRNLIVSARAKKNRYLRLTRKPVNFTQLKSIYRFPMIDMKHYRVCITVEEKGKRVHPFKVLARRTIGLARDNNQVGLEAAYDTFLKGQTGLQLMQRIPGAWIPVTDEYAQEPINGKDIYTTIDISLQDVAETALMRVLEKNKADHGCAILMEVKTGKIKALANLGVTENGTYDEIQNYAVTEAMAPGSTFKLATAAAVLESGAADTNTVIDLEGGLKVYGKGFKARDHELKEKVATLKRAFEISSNVGLSKAAVNAFGNNPQAYFDYLKKFGLFNKTNIDLTSEARPVLHDTHHKLYNRNSTLPATSVGYESQLTPLETLCFYNAIINNGQRMKPYLVEEIRSFGKLVKRFEPTPVGNPIVSASTCGKLRAMMEGVVSRGTAKGEIKNINYRSGGKTGTAQIPDAKKGFSEGSSLRHLASFCGYFPADNPVYSCIIVVFDPKAEEGRYYGSQIACPVFRELADVIYASSTNLHTLQPNLRDSSRRTTKYPAIATGAGADLLNVNTMMNIPQMNVEQDLWYTGTGANNGVSLKAKSNFGAARKVPELTGFSAKDAIYIVERLGYQARVEGAGKVIRQSPSPGTPLAKGEIVHFVLGMPSISSNSIDRPKKDSTKRK